LVPTTVVEVRDKVDVLVGNGVEEEECSTEIMDER